MVGGVTSRKVAVESVEEAESWTGMDRVALIERHLPLVRYVVSRMPRLGPTVSLSTEDLVSSGTIGLIEAIDRFEPGRGMKFSAYALHRIRGAIIDAIRVFDPLPRSLRQRVKELDRAERELAATLGRKPTRGELCQAADLTDDQYRETMMTAERIAVPLAPMPQRDHAEGVHWEPPIRDDDDFTGRIEMRETIEELGVAIGKLPERERLIIALNFKEGLKLFEIAAILHVSESRVNQLRARAVERLRTWLQPAQET